MADPPDDLAIRHLARVVESSDDAIVSKDLNGIITSWNRAAERMFGYTAAEAIGQSIRMIIPADRQAEEDMVLARIRAGQAITHFDTIRQRKDGTLIPISLTVSPIHDDAGQVIGASKIARDISDRVAGRRRQSTARRHRRIVGRRDRQQGSERHHHVVEPGGRTDVRLHRERSHRPVDSHDHSGRSAGRRRHGPRRASARVEAITHFETIRQRKDGTLIPISLTVSPIHDDAGRVIGASKIARDISDRAQAALASRRLAAVVESSDDAIITKRSEQHHHVVESGRRAHVRLHGSRGDRAIDPHADSRGAAGRRRCGPRQDSRRREDRPLRDDSAAQGWHSAVDLAHRLADPERAGRDRRRLEDGPRYHRAIASARGGPRTRGEHREARRGRRRRRLHARARDDRPESHRHRDGADARRVRRIFLQRDRSRIRRSRTCSTRCRVPRGKRSRSFPILARRPCLPRRFTAKDRSGSTTSPPIRATATSAPYFGMPPGHLPVRSYLAVPVKGVNGRRPGRVVLRPLPGRCVHRAARAARARSGGVGLGGAGERPAVRGGAGREPDEGRVSRRPLTRAAHAAECDRRLLATAARRHPVGRQGGPRPRDARTQRHVADADRGGRPRRLAHRVGQDSPGRAAGGAAAHRRQRGGDQSSPPPTPRVYAFRPWSIRASDPCPAIRAVCNRSSGIWCPTR